MHPLPRILLALLATLVLLGAAGATIAEIDIQGRYDDLDAVTHAVVAGSFEPGQPFRISGTITYAATGLPTVGATVLLHEQGADGAWTEVARTLTDADGDYAFELVKSVPGTYLFRALVDGQQVTEGWRVTILGPGETVGPTVTPTFTTTTTTPSTAATTAPIGSTYADARESYHAGSEAWSLAWGASDPARIREHLNQAKTEYSRALATASAVNDPANEANLAFVESVSTAYCDLADAALAMYDGADLYSTARMRMDNGSYDAAATSFTAAGATFANSQVLFGQATATLQSVSFAGTEYGDGSAYTAAIVPILDAKAAYVGEFAQYTRGWQHAALAYQARVNGDEAAFRAEATEAMTLFDGLRSSSAFGADAAANHNVLAGMLGG